SSTTGVPSTISALLRARSLQVDAPFLLCGDRDWTYGEFSSAVDAFAAGLLGIGIGNGDRIAIATPNCAEWLITWHAAVRIGAVLVTLNVVYREREFEFMLNHSGAEMLVCSARD